MNLKTPKGLIPFNPQEGVLPLVIAPILHFSGEYVQKLTTFLSMCQKLGSTPSKAHIGHLCSSEKSYKCKWPN